MLLQGKLRQVVRWVTGRNKGGLLFPTDTGRKMGNKLVEFIASKHTALTTLSLEEFCQYDIMPTLIDIDIMSYIMEKVAKDIQGAAGPGGIDASTWQDCTL